MLLLALGLSAEQTYYQIELVPSGQVIAPDVPVTKGTILIFHKFPDGTLISIRRADVKAITTLSEFAESQMRKVPDWITPQVYLGIAEIRLGDPDRGEELLQGAEQRIGGDRDYAGILPLISLELKAISDPLDRAIAREHEVLPPRGAPTVTPCPK